MNRVCVGDEFMFKLRKKCDDYVDMSHDLYDKYGMRDVETQEELFDGQYSLRISAKFPKFPQLPKSIRFITFPDDWGVMSDYDSGGWSVFRANSPDLTCKIPITLLALQTTCVAFTTRYGSAQPKILRAMLAMYKMCTVLGYGKDIACIITRAMLETGAIYATDWIK